MFITQVINLTDTWDWIINGQIIQMGKGIPSDITVVTCECGCTTGIEINLN